VNYNDMIRMVAGRTGLTRREADRAVVGTLTVLSEAISAGETKDLLAQLPKSVRDRVPVSGETLSMRPIELVARVADLTETASTDVAEMHVRAVFATLAEAVNAGEMQDVAEQLGPEFGPLLGRPVPTRRDDGILRAPVALAGRIISGGAAVVGRVLRAPARLAALAGGR
jgi:uncharacterized protein (DUF2267 family)